jgi:rubredoxin
MANTENAANRASVALRESPGALASPAPMNLVEFDFTPNANAYALMKKYMCLICGHIYDEALGDPDTGVAPGTKWEDVPPTWTCPDCGARKEDYELVEF